MSIKTNCICPVCDSKDIDIFIEIPQIPVYCNILYKSREEALAATRADMKLGFCDRCGHVYNYNFDPELMDYTLNYENSLHFSLQFQNYAEDLAMHLVDRYNLYKKNIIEIGCGDGDFLALLCKFGSNRGLGFDPSHVPDLDKEGAKKGITFIRDYYSEKYGHYQADMIVCRHVLEHLQYPAELLQLIRKVLQGIKDVLVFFEVPNALYTLRDLGIWDLIYEHCSYFTPQSLQKLFQLGNYQVGHLSETFNGQFLTIESRPSGDSSSFSHEFDSGTPALSRHVIGFRKAYNDKLRKWHSRLYDFSGRNEKVILWGAGSKGATFLNINGSSDSIDYVVDINPRKTGHYTAGTGQLIVAPEFLRKYKPDRVVLMNANYRGEILRYIDSLGVSADLLVA